MKTEGDFVKKGAMCFEQVQRFILKKKIFWGYVHFKHDMYTVQSLLKSEMLTTNQISQFCYSFGCTSIITF